MKRVTGKIKVGLSKLLKSLQQGNKLYGTNRRDDVGKLARTIEKMQVDLVMSEIDLHTMMMERERQEYLMLTIDTVASTLLSTAIENEEEFDSALQDGLAVVAQCVDVDGIYVWRNSIRGDNKIFELQAEWTNSSCELPLYQSTVAYSYDDTPEWEESFASGIAINGPTGELSERERKMFGENTKSILVLPVHLQERFWGLVFLNDCKQERIFNSDEVRLLQSASLMIISAVRRKKQAMRINEANARVRLMMDSTPVGCFLWNNDLQIFDCNPATLTLFKADTKEKLMIGVRDILPIHQLNGRLSVDMMDEYLEIAFEEGFCNFEFVYSAFDGTLFPVEVNLRRVNFEGEYVVAEYIRDIREQQHLMHELERRRLQLERALKEAQQANKAKSDFLSNMSHEIRTPLNAIMGMTTIGFAAESLPKKEDALKKIESASSHLMGVINDILDMSKIEAGKLDVDEVAFELEKVLNKVLNIVLFRVEEKSQNFHIHVADNVPEIIIGDDQRLAQVLTNLLGNAIKFTSEGKDISFYVTVEDNENSHNKGNKVTLKFSIVDSGIGISKEQQALLFTSFTQAEASTTRKYGGTGLGLAISKHIVELMGGTIWVESELGKGANFSFVIDFEVPLDGKSLIESHKIEDGMTYPGKTLLLAEDVLINQEIVTAILTPMEIKLDCVENGEEAVKAFTDNPQKYDLIFMDVQMPIMDGFEATEKIRSSGLKGSLEIPIIAMTANAFREDVVKCLERGMNGHLSKPLDMQQVFEVLWKYLR